MQHSVKTNYMYVQQLIFFSCFVNIHITDICTIDLQKKNNNKNFLSRKLFEEFRTKGISFWQPIIRHFLQFNNQIFSYGKPR